MCYNSVSYYEPNQALNGGTIVSATVLFKENRLENEP